MTSCQNCGHTKTEHRYGYGPCRNVTPTPQTIHDVDHPERKRITRDLITFCACKRLVNA